MTDREIDVLIGQIRNMATRIGCNFTPDPEKLLAFRCAQREKEKMRDFYREQMSK